MVSGVKQRLNRWLPPVKESRAHRNQDATWALEAPMAVMVFAADRQCILHAKRAGAEGFLWRGGHARCNGGMQPTPATGPILTFGGTRRLFRSITFVPASRAWLMARRYAARFLRTDSETDRGMMTPFQARYHRYDEIWRDCYLGYFLEEVEWDSPSKARLLRFFSSHTEFDLFQSTDDFEWLVITEKSLRQIKTDEAIAQLETTITQAIRYGSNARLPDGEARQIAQDFLAVFDNPLVFTNHGQPLGGSHGYSLESFVCCVDRHRLGFILSIENE